MTNNNKGKELPIRHEESVSDMFEETFDKIFRKKKRSNDVSPHLHEYELNKSTGAVQRVDNDRSS